MYGRGAAYELNPHLAPNSGSDYACPYGECDGSGFVIDDDTDSAVPCRCREGRIASARARNLAHEIPERYQGLALDRNPVKDILDAFDRATAAHYRAYVEAIDDRLDSGEGLWFKGDRGTGKTTLAMLISIHAMRARRSVGIYTAPKLLEAIRGTYSDDSALSLTQLMDRLRSVDLLHIEDLAVPRSNEWVLEQLYTVVNDRYQDRKTIIFTADIEKVSDLGERIGTRTVSRLLELCGDPIHMHGTDHRAPWLEAPSDPVPPASKLADRLHRLSQMLEREELTEAQFEKIKARLMQESETPA